MTQETKLKSIGRYSVEYGAISGIAGIIWGLILLYLDMHYQNSVLQSLVGAIISIVVVVYAFIAFRKEYGFLKIGQCVKIGLGIGVISGIIGSLYYLVMTNWIDPDFIEKSLNHAMDAYALKNPNLSQEDLDNIRIGQEFGRKPLFAVASILIIFVIYNFLIGLIGGIFLKTKS